jgi:hypothetical protein
MMSLYFSIDLVLPAAQALGSTQCEGEGRPARKSDNLTAICEPIA